MAVAPSFSVLRYQMALPIRDAAYGKQCAVWLRAAPKLEVDAVLINRDGEATAIEVEAGADVRPDDVKGLRAFLASSAQPNLGIVFYSGSLVLQLDEKIWAVPITAQWKGLSS